MRAYRFSPPQIVAPEFAALDRKQSSLAPAVKAVAVLVAVSGLYSLVLAAGARELSAGLAASLAGFGLELSAVDLWNRKRWGWRAALALLYALALFHLIAGWHVAAGGLYLTATVVMFPTGPKRSVEQKRLTLAGALYRTVFALSVPLLYAFSGLAWMGFGVWAAASSAVHLVTLSGGWAIAPGHPQAMGFAMTVLAMTLAAIGYSATVLYPWLAIEFDLRPATGTGRMPERVTGWRRVSRADSSHSGPVRGWEGVSSCAGLQPAGSARFRDAQGSEDGGMLA